MVFAQLLNLEKYLYTYTLIIRESGDKVVLRIGVVKAKKQLGVKYLTPNYY